MTLEIQGAVMGEPVTKVAIFIVSYIFLCAVQCRKPLLSFRCGNANVTLTVTGTEVS